MSASMRIVDQIQRKYRHLGLRSLLTTSPRSVILYFYVNHVLGVIDQAELRKHAERQGSLWEFGSKDEVVIEGRGEKHVPDPFEPIERTYNIDQPFVCELSDCLLVGARTPIALFGDEGRVILEFTKNNRSEAMHRIQQILDSCGWLNGILRLQQAPKRNQRVEYDFLFPMIKRPSFSYYHWLVEYLPRVRALEHYERATDETPDILIEPSPPDWLLDTLELVGIQQERCVEWEGKEARVDRLVVPKHFEKSRGEFLYPAPEDYQWLRSRVLSHEEVRNIPTGEFSDRIYISRQDATERRVVNFEEVTDTLRSMGFVPYELEELSFAEQARMFSQAEMIVGPHGAGLTNVVFASDSAQIIDLINEDRLTPGPDYAYYYFVIAYLLGLEYDYLNCAPRGTDMVVDADRLSSLIEAKQ